MGNSLCPCGSGKNYTDCCEPIITGKSPALTVESLMRSRYSAYALHQIDHIINSCIHDSESNDIDVEETTKWSNESNWLGLKILAVEKGGENDTEGMVQFSATYERRGLKDDHLEQAYFKKVDGRWLYEKGNLIPTTIVRSGNKVGRNEKCPCGSGKKYKQCCGR